MRTIEDKEFQKFKELASGEVAVRVTQGGSGTLLEGVTYDYIAATYPTTSSEVYTYRNGGSGGTVVATVTVTYSDATKETLTSVERS